MRSIQGFSLVEMILTLAIVGILISLSVPNLTSLLRQNEVSIMQKTLILHVNLAKSSAANSGHIVTLCPSSNGAECAGSWTQGSMLFIDKNANRRVDPEDRILRIRRQDISHGKLEWRAFGRRQYLQFNPIGYLLHQNGSFTYCDNSGDPTLTRQLVVNSVGRVRIALDSDGDDIREDSRGRAIRCS
ncbi:MAG: GspH/FimT family pseudopilin [Gammaproteobacteria bacterium]